MFADRCKEGRRFGSVRPGLFDLLVERLRNRHWGRVLARAVGRVFSPDRDLSCRLARNTCLTVTGARYCRVRCLGGALWVTAEGDGRDRMLGPGQGLTLTRNGRVVVSARTDASEVSLRWN